MPLKVVGAGVGRTGTASLKLALERLLGGRCHHMLEVVMDTGQVAGWTDAIEGRDVDWQKLLSGFVAQVDWPGAAFWREISDANPDALVLLQRVTPRRGTAAPRTPSSKPFTTGPRGHTGGSRRRCTKCGRSGSPTIWRTRPR